MMSSFALVCLSLAVVAIAQASDVVDLTPDNFDTVVNGDKHVLVEFFAPWCGHCKNLAPVYEVVGTTFKDVSDVVVAKVDADAHNALGVRFGVSGFPTIKFFPKGSTEPEDYSGGRSEEDFVDYLNNKAGTSKKIAQIPSNVVTLTPKNFDAVVFDPEKVVLVEFYAPWCGHCKNLAPKYEIAANAFAGEDKVVLAKVDADKHKSLGGRFGVKGFPTLKTFGFGAIEQPTDYQGGRDEKSIVKYLNEVAGTHRTVDGRLKESAGRVETIDVILSENAEIDESVLELTEKAIEGLEGDQIKHGNLYVKAIKKILSKGKDYIDNEISRLERMIEGGSISEGKKTLFMLRVNILKALRKD